MTTDDEKRFGDVDTEDEAPPIIYDDDNENGDDDDEDDENDENEDFDEVEESGQEEPAPLDAEEDEDEEEAPPGNIRDGVGRAAAVLKYIVERIVDEPDKISIGAAEDERGPVLLLRVAEDDRGKVIGRQGRIVQAIRTVVKAATVGTGEKVSVEIID